MNSVSLTVIQIVLRWINFTLVVIQPFHYFPILTIHYCNNFAPHARNNFSAVMIERCLLDKGINSEQPDAFPPHPFPDNHLVNPRGHQLLAVSAEIDRQH